MVVVNPSGGRGVERGDRARVFLPISVLGLLWRGVYIGIQILICSSWARGRDRRGVILAVGCPEETIEACYLSNSSSR